VQLLPLIGLPVPAWTSVRVSDEYLYQNPKGYLGIFLPRIEGSNENVIHARNAGERGSRVCT